MKTFGLLIIALLIFACGGQGDISTEIAHAPLEDVLTLELTFGAEFLPDEYLLADPFPLVVSGSGDVIVGDEQSIKIYDLQGKPKRKFGRYGVGPGEFTYLPCPAVSPTGYIGVTEIEPRPSSYNVFTLDGLAYREQGSYAEQRCEGAA